VSQLAGCAAAAPDVDDYQKWSRNNWVGTVTSVWAGRPRNWVWFAAEDTEFLLSIMFRSVLGPTQSPTQCVPGAVYPGVKRPGCEVEHSPISSAEVKNGEAIIPLHTSSWRGA
jgi:hypothetical protein